MSGWILMSASIALALVGVTMTVIAIRRHSAVDERPWSPARIAPWIRRVAVAVVGSCILVIGLIFLLLPGPGVLTCVGGLAILSIEFEWPRSLLQRVKRAVAVFRQPADAKAPPPRAEPDRHRDR